MIIDCIADLHGHFPKLGSCDLLIIAGDLTAYHGEGAFIDFRKWISHQNYKKIVIIAGNHDTMLQYKKGNFLRLHPEVYLGASIGYCTYLCDSGTELSYQTEGFPEEDQGFLPNCNRTRKIWGSPWTCAFPGMNPDCKAFTLDTDDELAEKWALIPDDTDILVTHCPPFGIRDDVVNGTKIESVGSKSLLKWVEKHPLLKLHVFGHIHEGYGGEINAHTGTQFVNASHVDEWYKPKNKPIRVYLHE